MRTKPCDSNSLNILDHDPNQKGETREEKRALPLR